MNTTKLASAIGLSLMAALLPNTSMAEVDKDVEVIVVQGQKIDRTLQETVNSVAVVTSKDIEQNNILNATDIFQLMPNVTGDFNQGFTIRGVNAFTVSGGGNSFLASMYLDGAPLPYRMTRGGGLSVWDLSQVEIFRGPQSTLQGRNALAGAIIFRSKDPTYEANAKARVTYGQYGQKEFAFAGGSSIVDDMLAFRVSYEDKNYDGDIDNTTRGSGSNFEDGKTLRAKLLFEPTEDLDAIFSYSQNDIQYGPQWSLYDYGDSAFDRKVDYNSPIWEQTQTDIYTLELTWDINDKLALHSVTTYNESEYRYNWDGDMSPTQIVRDTVDHRIDETFSQEMRLTYESDEVKAVIGAYTSKVDVDDTASGERFILLEDAIGVADFATAVTGFLMQQGLDAQTAYQTATAVAPFYQDIDPIILDMGYGLTQEIKTSALYADVTWSISDKIDLLAGLRYDTEEQTNSADNQYKINNNMPNPAQLPAPINSVVTGINAFLNGFAEAASGVEPPSTADFDAWLPKLGATYHVNHDISASLVFQRGYRSGGVGTNIARSRIYTYDPEYTDNYELSLRSVLMDGKLVFNANAFLLEWKDQQVSQQLSSATFDTETVNAGESEVKGFETEIFYYPNNSLTLTAGLGLAKSKFTDFGDATGRSFADTPEWTANIAANYSFDNGVYLNVNANYADEGYAYLEPSKSLSAAKYALNADPKNDARLLVNAQLGYAWDNYSVKLDARNLLDEDYINAYFSDADARGDVFKSYGQMQVGKPRQISVSFQIEF